MSTLMVELGIHRMSRAARIELARDILDSVAAEETPDLPALTPEKWAEIQRRREDARLNPDDKVTLAEFNEAMIRRYGS